MTDSHSEAVTSSHAPLSTDAAVDPAAASSAEDSVHHEVEPLLRGLSYRLRELVPVGVSVALGITVLVMTNNIVDRGGAELGPRFWPVMLAIGAICLGLLLVLTNVLRGVRPGDIPAGMTWWGVSRIVATGVLLVGYVSLFNVLQFWLITILVVLILVWLYGIRGWKALVLFPVIIGGVLHLLFITLLGVPL